MSDPASYQQPTYSIGVIARLTGLSTHNLRMWERRYGLGASIRSSTGRREFTKTDLDHLRLVKQLIDRGMRIGDIARLPQKTLSSLCIKQTESSHEAGTGKTVETAVVGHSLSQYFDKHRQRYPQLALSCQAQSIEEWLRNKSANDGAQVYLLQADMINKNLAAQLRKLKQANNCVGIFYRYGTSDISAELENLGVVMARGTISTESMDTMIKEMLRQQSYSSLLAQSAEAFNLPLPSDRPRQFSEQQLTEAATRSNELNCECPSHLSELIGSLNAFEDYSQQCGADNWKEASVHACIYAYTTQARYLMEKALVAVLEEQAPLLQQK